MLTLSPKQAREAVAQRQEQQEESLEVSYTLITLRKLTKHS